MIWFYLIGVLLVVALAIPLISAFKISSLKLMPGTILPVKPHLIPSEQIDVLVKSGIFIQKQGFEFQQHVTRSPIMHEQEWGLYGAVYLHKKSNTWALVYVEPIKHPVFSWRVLFLTSTDKGFIVTESGSEFHTDLKKHGFFVSDPKLYSPLEQWQYHQSSLKEYKKSTYQIKNISEILAAFEMLIFQGMIEINLVKPWKDGYRLSFKNSLLAWVNAFSNQRKLLKQKYKMEQQGDNGFEFSMTSQSEYAAYLAFKRVQESNKKGWLSKTGMLLVTVILFGVSFGLLLSLETLFFLIVVLFIHEAGHLFGMWLFGYKDLRMLFIPFMGALASGKKEKVSAWQEAIVLLLGPMPGYILGITVLFSQAEWIPEWLAEYAILSVILNAINLLPVMPLDGGRIVSLGLFNRLPMFQLFLTLVSTLVLAYAGIFLGEPAGLIISIILIITLPNLWKEIQLLRYLLKQKLHKDFNGTEQLLEIVNSHPLWEKMMPQNKWPLLDSLSYRVQHANAGLITCVAILALWLTTIILPVYAVLPEESMSALKYLIFQEEVNVTIDDLIEQYNDADSDSERVKFALLISRWSALEVNDRKLFYWNKAKEFVASDRLTNMDKARYYSDMSELCIQYEEQDCEVEYLEKSVEYYSKLKDKNELTLIALTRLAKLQINKTEASLAYLDEAERIVAEGKNLETWMTEISIMKAHIFENNGDVEKTEAQIERSVKFLNTQETYSLSYYQRQLINLYVEIGKSDKAIDVANQWLAAKLYVLDEWTPLSDNLYYMIIWLLVEKQPDEASKLLESVKPNSTVDKIEWILAKIVINQEAGNDDFLDTEALRALVNSVENDYEWASLARNIMKASEQTKDRYESNALAEGWYQRMEDLLFMEEYKFILKELNDFLENNKFGSKLERNS
jgi:Zn-dependent protease